MRKDRPKQHAQKKNMQFLLFNLVLSNVEINMPDIDISLGNVYVVEKNYQLGIG